jgi:Tol biopolymer transport system component
MSLSWSSDGRQLVYLTDDGLRILTLENGEVRPVDTGQCTSYAPALSPDGKWIAVSCNGMKTDGVYYLDLLPVKGGAGKHLFRFTGFGGQVAWTNDSQRIIIPDGGSLWEININGGEPRRVSISAERAGGPAIASHGDRLAYASWQYSSNIWRVDTRTGLDRTVFAPSIVEQRLPDISPDGKRIAFNSERSGSQEVWVANLDGSDAVQLSNFHARTGMAKWSPDGRWIAFDSRVSGKAALYIVDPVMALPRQVSTSGIPAADPSWSRDGKWIYFSSPTSDPTGLPPFYRVPPQGGVPERVAQARGFAAQQSKDGRLLYFAIGKEPENERGWIYVLNIATGEQHTLNGMPIVQCENDWVVGSKGIFFVVWTPKPGIDFYDFSSQRVTRTVSLDRLPSDWGGLSLSPDETWLAYSQIDEVASHLMLVEGFR